MNDVVPDPGTEAVDRILDDLEDLALKPTEVARQARRLRAHIDALRDQIDGLTAYQIEPDEENQ